MSLPNKDELLKEFVAHIQRHVTNDRAAKVQRAVRRNIDIILAEVADKEQLFKVSEVIQVGSYAEGTKILEPDEFDFLVVIEDLSIPGATTVNFDANNVIGYTELPKPGIVTVEVQDESLKSKWDKYLEGSTIKCFECNVTPIVNKFTFGNIFLSVLREKKTNRSYCSYSPGRELDMIHAKDGIILEQVDDISLKLVRVQFMNPNIIIELDLDGFFISVDVSPALRYHKLSDCFSTANCASEHLGKLVSERGSILLVSQKYADFRVTFTETEVDYLQHVISHKHKTIYIFLKYANTLFKQKRLMEPFSSYMLKNICIHHDIKCKGNASVLECLETVVNDIESYVSTEILPNVFNLNIDVFGVRQSCMLHTQCTDYLLHGLRRIMLSLDNVIDVESFLKLIDESIESSVSDFHKKLNHEFLSYSSTQTKEK